MGTVYDTGDNLQYRMDQLYAKRSSQYRLQPRKRPKHYQIPENCRRRKSKYPDVDTQKRLTKPR